MGQYKICVYAISKNEEKFVDRWMDSVGEADLVIVVDTGSTDRTVEKLRERGAAVYEEKIVPWRFDEARNRALAHVPDDVDICVSIDLDEIHEPGWRKVLESAWSPEYTRARYPYIWNHRSDGAPDQKYEREKIHRRHDFHWIRPVHEILEYTGEGGENEVWIEELVLHHYPDLSKPRSQYLPLLELSVKENPFDDRAMFWLGREYLYYREYESAIETLKRYLKLPTARWGEERSAAMRLIAQSYESLRDGRAATTWLFRAVEECPTVREPYLAFARLAYGEKNWPLVYTMVRSALSITRKSGSYLTEPECWGAEPYDLGAVSAYYLGLYEKAQNLAEKACKMRPADERLKSNLELIRRKVQEQAD
ncbi:glycosyltransferase [Faecalispora sporosphaeroides]|uniref:Glycosyltransferase n=1 Tax=Faecalispora sporosphaeroides TaxID=1549 RepID=A0A928KSX0_9FIRM|nr:glycosyltransferase [Faecalispora sporosphaeroides]MBE6833945.1 glycosyltransferase [Faecalispora sporosphaeroides]